MRASPPPSAPFCISRRPRTPLPHRSPLSPRLACTPLLRRRPQPGLAAPSRSAYQPFFFQRRREIRTMASQPVVAGPKDEGEGGPLKLVNRLSESRSPYVRGHMNNPVAWQMWSPEALALAKKHNRLVFVSIGYAACHWCHVMERESFENPEVAAILNDYFIPIKIDREERPDVDRIYMNYVQATTGSGGWPLNVFLTPGLEPLYGGTYWPGPGSASAHSIGFVDILRKMREVWTTQQQRCLDSAKEITTQLRQFAQEGMITRAGVSKDDEGDDLDLELLEEAYDHFQSKFDGTPGCYGFGVAPKFPTPANLQFLLSLGQYPSAVADVVGESAVKTAKSMALSTLLDMYHGGIHDQIGNGFARYSVTRDWSLPHFEKMLYDQAQLLKVYLDAYLISKDSEETAEASGEFLAAVLDIGAYLTSPPMHAPNGGFYSAEDADSLYRPTDAEKREGAFYVWTLKEFQSILGDRDSSIAAAYWDVQENGNVTPEFDAHDEFINQNVPAVVANPSTLAGQFGLPTEAVVRIINDAKRKLREHREKERPRPALDDKIIVSWNGLAIGALARASVVLERSHPENAKTFLDAAIKATAFIRKELFDESAGTMKRVYREGPGDISAFADDYAFLIGGLIDLYEATFDDGYLEFADRLQKTQISLFWDEQDDAFFSTTAAQPDLILRLKDGMDNAEPSTNGFSANNLNRLASIFGDEHYAALAKRTAHAFAAETMQHPFLFVGMLDAVVTGRLHMKGVVVTGEGAAVEKELEKLKEQTPYGRTLVRLGGGAKGDWLTSRSELLKAMNPTKPGVQICEGNVCKEVLPVANSS